MKNAKGYNMNKQKKVVTVLSILVLSFNSTMLLAEDSQNTNVAPVQNQNQVLKTPDYTGDLSDRSALFGDIGGERQKLANEGITIDANLTQVTQGVVSGGVKERWNYMGRGETTLNMDTAKMGLWPGGLFTVMGEGNYGTSLSRDVGAALGVNVNDLLPETENSFVLPQVTYTQFLSSQFGIAVGKFATITNESGDMNEFAHGKGADKFLNTNFNFNPIIALVVPYSTLGINAIYLPTKDLIVTAGALNPHGDPGSAGIDELFDDGATFVAEARLTTDFFNMKGHQFLGGAYSTSNYADLDQRAVNFIIPGLPVQESDDSWAVFWNADQYIYQPDTQSDRGVGLFARFGLSDGEANPINSTASFGVSEKGMLFNREDDKMGLGYFYLWSADTRITNEAGFDDSQGMEAYYQIALTPAVHLSPNIQWIQPSQQRVEQSWVLGMRLYTAF